MYKILRQLSVLCRRQVKIVIAEKRCASTRFGEKLSGPGLKYFVAQSQGTECVPGITEKVPYVSDSDLDGAGRKVYFQVQGCQMNNSDAEIVWSILKSKGYEKTDNFEESDVILLVTCAIRDSAEAKIWQTLTRLQGIKRNNGLHYQIGILGCMAERLKENVLERNRIVDFVAGPDSYKDLPRLLALLKKNVKSVNVLLSLDETYADVIPVRLNENTISAYVSIMRGCDNMCTYCIVPFTRGKERSRPIESVLDEVRMLSDQGVKEITLLGQNVNSYRDMSSVDYYNVLGKETGMSSDFKTVYKQKTGGIRFGTLLDKVSSVDPEMRIRFTSPHPKDFPDDVLHLIRERKNICNSIHLPAQSGSNTVLERMRRGYTREAYLKLVDHIRDILPDVGLTTDIICGFCGETEKDHEETMDLIKTVKYNFVYMYPYSLREKTTAHRRYVDNVPFEKKKQRASEIGILFRTIAEQKNKSLIGSVQLVLVAGKSKKSEDYLEGRNDGNNKVIIKDNEIPIGEDSKCMRRIKVGDYISVMITDATSQTLHGTPLYHSTIRDFKSNKTGNICV